MMMGAGVSPCRPERASSALDMFVRGFTTLSKQRLFNPDFPAKTFAFTGDSVFGSWGTGPYIFRGTGGGV